jgi:hypothetical protein
MMGLRLCVQDAPANKPVNAACSFRREAVGVKVGSRWSIFDFAGAVIGSRGAFMRFRCFYLFLFVLTMSLH